MLFCDAIVVADAKPITLQPSVTLIEIETTPETQSDATDTTTSFIDMSSLLPSEVGPTLASSIELLMDSSKNRILVEFYPC